MKRLKRKHEGRSKITREMHTLSSKEVVLLS